MTIGMGHMVHLRPHAAAREFLVGQPPGNEIRAQETWVAIEERGALDRLAMEGAAQMAVPILGIVAVAAVTFYAVSFAELREKSFEDLEDSEETASRGGFKSSASSRERRAKRKAEKEARK